MNGYQVSGSLMKGFLGHISYETVLSEENEGIEISFSFGKRLMENVSDEDREAASLAWKKNYGKDASEEEKDRLIGMEKTEINLSVFHNGAYVGCAHRDETERRIWISPLEASAGFTPWSFKGGVLRIVLHCYQILNDDTPYELIVSGKEAHR